MKKQRIKGRDRILMATRQKLMQQVNILSPEEKEELNEQLDAIDNMEPAEAATATLALTAWLQNKWEKYNEPICVQCNRQSFCKRQQTVKKCKFFEEIDNDESE